MDHKTISDLVAQGAVFYCSHSGGKDSQAMYAHLRERIPAAQLVVVHADLGEVEWSGVQDHIRANIDHPLNVVRAGKTFFDMVRRRGMWPSSSTRQCTSDLKRDPIAKFMRQDLKARGASIGINCMGIRAQESSARAKKQAWSINKRMCTKTRTVYDWMPIHAWSESEVFARIAQEGQAPHWAYKQNKRLSCVFCIMGCQSDLQHGARENPELYRQYVELEREIGHTVFQVKGEPVGLEEYTGIQVADLIATDRAA